jgi:hypothetical protein
MKSSGDLNAHKRVGNWVLGLALMLEFAGG